MYFDRFDICEAYAALEADYNVGGVLQPRGKQVAAQLSRIGFRLGAASNPNELSENGQAIYEDYVASHGLRSFPYCQR